MNPPDLQPFGEIIVQDPRRPEPEVASLNERPFRALLAQFDRVAAGPLPRVPNPVGQALLITSEQPGYGKSHLIGRLFRALHGRATLVYVLPFQNAATVFQSLALALTRELHFPDRTAAGTWDREAPTQLDALAHGVLAHTLADLVENGRDIRADDDPTEIAARLRADPLAAFHRGAVGPNWSMWMRQHFEKLLPLFEEALARRGLTLDAPAAWLRVLFCYAFAPFEPATRRAALDWIAAQPLEEDELARLGLRAADGVPADIDPEDANNFCRTRIAALTQLAGFFRPFVFCFDQTEVYGHAPRLARAFGMAVATLMREASHHVTLVAANQEPWSERIVPHLEKADFDRIARPSLALEGINRAQAAELALLRLESVGAGRVAQFLDPRWLAELFPTERNQMGTRQFLQRCKERWEKPGTPPEPPASLAELFRERRAKLLADEKRHGFEPDTLQWLVEEAARGVKGIAIEASGEKYFPVLWRTSERVCRFGFIAGSYGQQWRAVARAAQVRHAADPPAKAVFFRVPGQPPIPGRGWKSRGDIEAAKASCLHLIDLNVEDVATLYAARDLFAEAAQGDIAHSANATLAFLRAELAPWWERLCEPIPEPTPPAS